MALIEFQTGLGRLLREHKSSDPLHGVNLDANEKRYFETLQETAGFRFCASIQRSWCIARAAKSAHFTLSLLPDKERQALLDDWVDAGAGTNSFFDAEGESFLGFISKRLTDPSHELSVCQFEQATFRASNGASSYASPDLSGLANTDRKLRHGRHATLVRLYLDPSLLIESMQTRKPLPPLSTEPLVLMFSPGLPQLCNAPSEEEIATWEALDAPASVGTLLSLNISPETLAGLLEQGTIDYAD
ncbi:MAG TPA: hypothetical protein VKC61_06360 [Pyrinomonadaceae bacterium]|nr:hypothetical protein [Pyrinomonadaceae bacterium]